MNYKDKYIWIGGGDSRNPEEMRSNTGMMHTNDVRTWIKYKGTWYQFERRCPPLALIELFLDCKTPEDYDWVFNCLIEENEIYKDT